MRGTNRNNALCFESLEEALAKDPETYGHLDLLCAGWPCQGNSIAGSRKGMQDKRSGLWQEARRIIGIFLPKWIVLENVPGLFSVNDGQDFWQVVSDLDSLGYCVAWDVLDSQNFGLAQRRARVFIVASFGNIGAAKVLFEPESNCKNHKKNRKMESVGLCISTRDGERQDPSGENIIASVVKASDYNNLPIGQFGNENNLIANTINTDRRGTPFKAWTENLVANTIQATDEKLRNLRFATNYVASTHANGKGKTSRVSEGLDSYRGIVLGNAVSVPVAKWIGERIMKFEKINQNRKEKENEQ